MHRGGDGDVNVTGSAPTALPGGADIDTVDSQTQVLENTSLSSGDVVAHGTSVTSGQTPSPVKRAPLRVLPQAGRK